LKFSLRAGSILTAVALSIVGCDPMEPTSEAPPKHEEHAKSKQGKPSPAPPVVPSPVPPMPESGNPEVKKDEPKVETPK
jgi:hypothetical protein